MLVVDVISLRKNEPLETKVICQLGWDEKQNRIKILKGKSVGKNILKNKYLDKRWPEKEKYIEASQGENFIRNLCYGLAGSRVWASKAYEENR